MRELRRLRGQALAAAADPHTELRVIAAAAVGALDVYGEVVRELGFDPLEQR
jgi:hypothetical protein